MPKVSVVDISDADRFQEIYNDNDDERDTAENQNESNSDDEDEELGLIPRVIFSTFSTLTLLVPLVSVHIALDIIVHQQYAQEVGFLEIAARAATAAIGTALCLNTYG